LEGKIGIFGIEVKVFQSGGDLREDVLDVRFCLDGLKLGENVFLQELGEVVIGMLNFERGDLAD